MPNAKAMRRKLTKKFINTYGVDTVIHRVSGSIERDLYGDPVGVTTELSIPIRIVIDQDRRDGESTEIGGMPNTDKEFIHFYVKGDTDIRIADRVIYHPGSDIEWMVDRIEPHAFKGIYVIIEARAYRDLK